MGQCEVCGEPVAERGFQVLVAGRATAYDTIECAERGRRIAAAGAAAFAHPFRARTIVVDVPRPPVAAAPPAAAAGIAAPLLARVSMAKTKLAFGGAWILASGLAAASLYLAARPGGTDSRAAEAGQNAQASLGGTASAAPFVHQVDLPPPGAGATAATERKRGQKTRRKQESQAVLVRSSGSGSGGSSEAAPAPPTPAPPPQAQPEAPPPPVVQPVSPQPPPAPVAEADDDDSKPGWGHGDENHEHDGPPGHKDD